MEVFRAWVWPVRFDDRLRTVLGSPAADPRDRAVRWRQLVELVARAEQAGDSALLDEAVAEIRAAAASVDEQVRMAAARSIAPLPLPVRLISAFAADKISVAAPVLAAARLTAFEWGDVLTSANPECRRFIRALRSEQADGSRGQEPASALTTSAAPAATAPDAPHEPIPSISEVVARIERLRQSREGGTDAESSDTPPPARLFRWECDENGEIAWVEGVPRGPLIGRSIGRGGEDGLTDRRVESAFAGKLPFRDARLELAEGTPLAGTWMISGIPAFDPSTGRFAGYRGIAERESASMSLAQPSENGRSDPDSLRELAHEIKTPLNAIIGFAEIITGQYLGPANHPYRERATEIATQARLLLAAIEDLDFAAKVHSSTTGERRQVQLSALIDHMMPSLRKLACDRDVSLEGAAGAAGAVAAVEPELAERLVRRLFCALIERANPGENLRLTVEDGAEECRISISRPRSLLKRPYEELFGSARESSTEHFALRLVQGLARIAGCRLTAPDDVIALVFRIARLGGQNNADYSRPAGEGL